MPPDPRIVDQWMAHALADLRAAELLIEAQDISTATVCFHCQQAAEKALKCFLVSQDVAFEWSHQIEYLLPLCVKRDASFDDFRESGPILSRYAVRFRYPHPEPDPSDQDAQEALGLAGRIIAFVRERIPRTPPRPV